jgi:hypothetical protein
MLTKALSCSPFSVILMQPTRLYSSFSTIYLSIFLPCTPRHLRLSLQLGFTPHCTHFPVYCSAYITSWTIRSSDPGTAKRFFSSPNRPNRLWGKPSFQWVLGVFSPEAKRPGREVGHSPPPSAEFNEWNYTSVLFIRLYGVDSDQFSFTFNRKCINISLFYSSAAYAD